MDTANAAAFGQRLPLSSVLPFAAMLLCIAVVPLAAPRFWARHYGKVSASLGAPVALWFLAAAPHHAVRTAVEYLSFLSLLGSLFVVTGGILVRGTPAATTRVNAVILLVGAAAANVLGTTGASMLLVRPLLRANLHRKRKAHVAVFFIFLVGNVGGLLTPVGDPPLFLGYLQGVPFSWPFLRLWPLWVVAVTAILAVFLAVDSRCFRRDDAEGHGVAPPGVPPPGRRWRVSMEGKRNLPLLAAVVASAAFLPPPFRELAMLASAAASLAITGGEVRRENGFSWHPIREVAVLFGGIFATMMPALLLLEARGADLPVRTPFQYFWTSGALSSFLDNAPTYLAFFHVGRSGAGAGPTVAGVPEAVLAAVSAGSVLMGANSYIGNAPNFMVKAVAEEQGVEMPSFPGYMGWAAAVLLPVFLLVSLLFFA